MITSRSVTFNIDKVLILFVLVVDGEENLCKE